MKNRKNMEDRLFSRLCLTETAGGHPRNEAGKLIAYYVVVTRCANPLYHDSVVSYSVDLYPQKTRCPATAVGPFRSDAEARAWVAENVEKRS